MKICDGKFIVSVSNFHKVRITSKDKGYIESQSVEAILLLEVVKLLKKILENQEHKMTF